MSSVIINLPRDTTSLRAEMDTKPVWLSDVGEKEENVWNVRKEQKSKESSINAKTSCDTKKEIN